MTSSQDYGSSYPSAVAGAYPTGAYIATDTDAPAENGDPSTADVAKDQASSVASSAADSAQHVAGVAKEQAGQVTAEASRQVKQLLGQAQSELSDQAGVQQQRAAGGLHAVGDQLKSMAENSSSPGMATDLAHQAADKAHQFAGWLEERDPGSVLEEVRTYARQRPGMFLAIALGAGLVAGRLARGLTADPDEKGVTKPATPRTPSPAVGSGSQAQLTGQIEAVPTSGDLYGTGLVPDWTGKSGDESSDRR